MGSLAFVRDFIHNNDTHLNFNSAVYSPNGNMTANVSFTYVWDDENRLAEVWKSGVLVQSNTYDALSRRHQKVEYDDCAATTCSYLYHGWLVLACTVASCGSLENYIHGADLSGTVGGSAGGIGGLLAAGNNQIYVNCHYDGNGNNILLTDGEGNSVYKNDYSPFGQLMPIIGGANKAFSFSTKELSSSTDLLYFGYRYYSTLLSRWIARDPSHGNEEQNLYEMCHNNPISVYDYLGLSCPCIDEAKQKLNFCFGLASVSCGVCILGCTSATAGIGAVACLVSCNAAYAVGVSFCVAQYNRDVEKCNQGN